MKKFMKSTSFIEPVFENSKFLFSEGNRLDLTIGEKTGK